MLKPSVVWCILIVEPYQNRSVFISPLQDVVMSTEKLLFYNSEMNWKQTNPFMTPDTERVIKSSIWAFKINLLNKKYSMYIIRQND